MIDPFTKSVRRSHIHKKRKRNDNENEKICLYYKDKVSLTDNKWQMFIDFEQNKFNVRKEFAMYMYMYIYIFLKRRNSLSFYFICMNTIRKTSKIIIEYLYNKMNNYFESFYLYKNRVLFVFCLVLFQ